MSPISGSVEARRARARPAPAGTTTTAPIASRTRDDRAEREGERDEVEPDEAALLVLVVDDVERVEDRLHAGVGAPQRDGKAEHEAEAERAVALGSDPGDLLLDDVERAARQRRRESSDEMVRDGRGVGEQRHRTRRTR